MKKAGLIVLAVLLVAGFAFAGGDGEADAGPGVTVNPPGTYPVVNERVTVDLITLYNQVENSGLLDEAEFTAYFEDLTNVEVNFVEIIESDQMDEKLNLILASGDLPDFFSTPFHISIQETWLNAQSGVFVPLTEMVNNNMPNLRAELDKYPQYDAQLVFPDNEYYAFPRLEANCYHCSYQKKYWVYQPWLDALGLDQPQTTDEFKEMLIAFRDGDPNGNGIQDEIPMVGATAGWNGDPLEYLMSSFVYTNKGDFLQRVDGGTVEFVANTPEWREGLIFMNELFDEGLLAQETYVQNVDQMRALVENPGVPIVGSYPAGWYGVYSVNGGGTGRFADFQPISPLEGPNGVRQAPHSPFGVSYHTVITNQAEEWKIPVIAQMWDWFYGGFENQQLSQNMNELGVYFREITADERAAGIVARDGVLADYMPLETVVYGTEKQDRGWVRSRPGWQVAGGRGLPPEWADDPSKQEWRLMVATSQLYEQYGNDRYMPPNLLTAAELQDERSDLEQIIVGPGNTAGLVDQYTAEFITGARDITDDAEWDAYVNELQRAGVDRWVEINQIALTNAGY